MKGGQRRLPETFSGAKAPANYVPGLGRGAMGFTTRSDIVPLAARTDFGPAPKGYVPGAGRGASGFGDPRATGSDGLENAADGEAARSDDREADAVWDAVDTRVASRRKKKRARSDSADGGRKEARIADQFADLKQQLKTVSFEEWDALPEARSGIRKHQHQEALVPVSDAIILERAGLGPSRSANLTVERGRMMRDKLDNEGNGRGETIDAQDYLSGLEGSSGAAAARNIGDIKKARALFKSVTLSNPSHPPGWIAAARLEEVDGNLMEARKLIKAGCKACPRSEEVWIEAARLNMPANAKVILGNAIQELPKSETIWLKAAELEGSDVDRQRRVLRRALETMPSSEKLWKAAIEMEEDKVDAHVLLARASECVPSSVDLWLALARMEDYKGAQAVLNKARKHNPREPRIWLAACALEEVQGNQGHVGDDEVAARLDAVVAKAIKALSKPEDEIVSREGWLDYATKMEAAESLRACKAIVRGTMKLNLEPSKMKRQWIDDAKRLEKEGHVETARALHQATIDLNPGEKDVLLRAVAFETRKGTNATLSKLLLRAVKQQPDVEVFWLMAAKERWKTLDDVAGARDLLERGLKAGHNTERVWLAAFKLEWESGEVGRAREVIERARKECPCPNVWVKSALLERVELSKMTKRKKVENQFVVVEKLLQDGIRKFPKAAKLYMMLGQLYLEFKARRTEDPTEKEACVASARRAYLTGLREVSNSPALWLLSAHLESEFASEVKARSVLELGRVQNPKAAELWLEAIRLEKRFGRHEMAEALMNKALQECPKAGILWAEVILSAPKPEQKAKCADALEKCERDAFVFNALGRLFAGKPKIKPARKWFEAAVEADPSFGDAWAYFFHFETLIAKEVERAKQVFDRCMAAEPSHGELWQSVAKLDQIRHAKLQEIFESVVKKVE